MIIFFGIVFTLYGLINYYIIRRALVVVPNEYKTLFLVIAIFVVVSYIAGRLIENIWISPVSISLVWIGSFWIAFMFYSFFLLVILDLLRIFNHFAHFFPAFINVNPEKAKRITALVVIILTSVTVIGGYINTKMIVTKKYNIKINKPAGKLRSLNLAIASDLHLGVINSYSFMYDVSEKLNELKPDIILLAGDIIDEDLAPVVKYDVGEHLRRMKAKYGIYAITGNHEYIGGAEPAVKYLTSHGITVLRDESIKIDSSFYLIGREDLAIRQFAQKGRKELAEILEGVDKNLPIILMDHQPFKLEQARQNGVDLQVSGHTHYGQMWPANYIVEKIYEIAWGYKVIDNTHYYVSCGVGGWGPPIRTGSRPEIINIRLDFVE